MLINQEKPALFFAYFSLTYFSLTVLFFEKKSRQKKLWLSGSLCGILIICADRACTKGKRNFGYRGVFRLPCVKGFASVRSTLAGVAETGSETAQRLEGFASVRSTLAGVAETGSETAQRLEGFASVRSTLAGVAETGSMRLPCVRGGGPRERWKGFASVRSTLAGVAETGCKKQSLTACGGAPFTQGSLFINCPSLLFSLFVFLSAQRPVLFEKC